MPTNRPFFANFLAAFRARSIPTYKAASSTTSATTTPTSLAATAHVSLTTTNATSSSLSTPRTIATKSSNQAVSSTSPTTITTSQSTNNPAALSAATAATASSHLHSPLSRSPGGVSPHNIPISMSPPGTSTPLGHARGRQRRGSDSSNSSGGFIDALGPEKWYIGGRTAGGEEKFYRLGVVTGTSGRRVRSLDRLSL